MGGSENVRKNKKLADCHPDRPSVVGGYCEKCYKRFNEYGLLPGQYDEMLERQSGVCAICHQNNGARDLAVDHCHETGRVRGLLCTRCNMGIGYFKDNPYVLRSAAKYLTDMDDHRDMLGLYLAATKEQDEESDGSILHKSILYDF